jgi:membrane fusion protein (multidrug efflux system)
MSEGLVAVVAPEEHVERIRRIAASAVWVNVAVVTDLAQAPGDRPVIMLTDPEPGVDPRVAYAVRAGLPDDQLQAVITAVATGSALASPASPSAPETPAEALLAQLAFGASRKLAAATDLPSTERTAVSAIIELLDVDRAYCLFYESTSGGLWSEVRQQSGSDDRTAVGGMAGWSARTGLPCTVQVGGDDPRYLGSLDDPDGDGADQVMVQPIIGADSKVHAVLIGVRRARRAPVGARESKLLSRFAALVAPLLDQLAAHVAGQQLMEPEAPGMFRAEATEAAQIRTWGDVIRVTPGWLSWAYWLLVVCIAGSVAFVSLAKVSVYSAGPAVIRSMARTSVTTRTAGNVASVEVVPGDKVAAGDLIARLDDIDQRTALERVHKEFESQLRNHMLDPADANADAAVRSLTTGLEQARTALDDRAIRAPSSGVVSELRVRPGQHVEPGDIAASVVDGNTGLEVVALLPGEDRPQLAPGMEIRLELAGYRYAYQRVSIETMSSDVISPTEARRVLGTEVADSLALNGPVVLVRGRIASPEFIVDEHVYRYHDGMLGAAEVRIRQERIIVALIPGLRRLTE